MGYTTPTRQLSVSLNRRVGTTQCTVVVVPQCMSEASSVCYARSANSYIHYRAVHLHCGTAKLSAHTLIVVPLIFRACCGITCVVHCTELVMVWMVAYFS